MSVPDRRTIWMNSQEMPILAMDGGHFHYTFPAAYAVGKASLCQEVKSKELSNPVSSASRRRNNLG